MKMISVPTEKGKTMTDREKLMELFEKSLRCSGEICGETVDCKKCKYDKYGANCGYAIRADYFIANGVTFREDVHWATEQAYKNGYEAGKKFATENKVAYKMKVTDEIDFDYAAED